MGRWMLAGLATALIVNSAHANVVTIGTSRDTTIYSDNTTASNGAGPHFYVGNTQSGGARRGLLAFNIAAAVPVGATITSVSLTLYESKGQFPDGVFDLHKLTKTWGEGASNAGDPGGTGAAAQAGDATWADNVLSTAQWNVPGGDFDSARVSSTQIVGGAGQSYTWPSTSTLVADAQAWLNSPLTNFGWIMLGDEANPGTAKRFETKEAFNSSQAPALTINYSVPEPASIGVVAIGLIGLTARRSRRNRTAA